MLYEVTYVFQGNLRFVFFGGGTFPEDGNYTRASFDDPEDFYSHFIMGDMEDVVDAVEHRFASVLETVMVRTVR